MPVKRPAASVSDDVLFFLRAKAKPGRKLDTALAAQAQLDGIWIVSAPALGRPDLPSDTPLVLHGHWATWSDDGFDEEETIALVRAIAAVAREGSAAIRLDGGVDGPYFAAFRFEGGELTRPKLVPDPFNPTAAQLATFDALWADDPPEIIRRGPRPQKPAKRGGARRA